MPTEEALSGKSMTESRASEVSSRMSSLSISPTRMEAREPREPRLSSRVCSPLGRSVSRLSDLLPPLTAAALRIRSSRSSGSARARLAGASSSSSPPRIRTGIDRTQSDLGERGGGKKERFSDGLSPRAEASGLLSSYTGFWVVSGSRSEGKVTSLSDLGRWTRSAPLLRAATERQAKVLRVLWWSASSMTDFLTLPRQRVEVKQKEKKT